MRRVLGVVLAAFASVAMVGTASAGEAAPTGDVRFNVPIAMDGDASAVLDAITVEMFDSNGSQVFVAPECVLDHRYGLPVSGANFDCTVAPDTYTIGLSGLPDGFYVYESSCQDLNQDPPERFENPEATFTLEADGFFFCDIRIAEYQDLYIDKVVTDPDQRLDDGETLADVSAFTLEVFDADGTLVTTVVDTAVAECDFFDTTVCAVVPDLAPGDYTFGEVRVLGYEGYVNCLPLFGPSEAFLDQQAFAHGERGVPTLCTINNFVAESEVTVRHVVVNDDTGTATSADFTAELFTGGSLAVDQRCQADGSCLVASLRVGDYTAGVDGPAGYTHTAVVTFTDVENEAIADAGASFTLRAFQSAEIVITSDDITPEPTTTTTTTTTTVAPTTAAPTTIDLGAGAGTLPATGPDQRARNAALMAITLVLLGAASTLVARRRQA